MHVQELTGTFVCIFFYLEGTETHTPAPPKPHTHKKKKEKKENGTAFSVIYSQWSFFIIYDSDLDGNASFVLFGLD